MVHNNSVTDIRRSEHANAVCAICLKHGKTSSASALRKFGHWVVFYVCEGHAERARGWDRVLDSARVPQ